MALTRDLYAARNLDFAPVLELSYSGDPLPVEGATISMEVRQYAGAPGDPEAEDADVTFSDTADPDNADQRILTVEPSIAKADLLAMPTGLNLPEVGEADRFEYEIKITYADTISESLWTGAFYLEPGVDA